MNSYALQKLIVDTAEYATNFQISDDPLCDPIQEDCEVNSKHPYEIYKVANLNVGILMCFTGLVPLLLYLVWRMPISSSDVADFELNPVYWAAWLFMWIGNLVEFLIPIIAWITLLIVEYNEKLVKMYTIWLKYPVYYSHVAVEGISVILLIVAWAIYSPVSSFTSVECGIVLLFYVAFSVGMTFVFYRFWEDSIMFYDPDVKADYDIWVKSKTPIFLS